jgi:GNAT superfamily N-acetyltransferase
MQIRLAEAADAQGIAEVHVRVWQIGYAPWVDAAYAEALSVRTSTMRWLASLADPLQADTLVAVEDSRIVGWTSYGVNRNGIGLGVGEVYGLYVDPDYWGEGIGAELLADATRALAEAGFESAIIWTIAADERARAFYEERGWTDDGESEPHESGAEVVRYSFVLRRALTE